MPVIPVSGMRPNNRVTEGVMHDTGKDSSQGRGDAVRGHPRAGGQL